MTFVDITRVKALEDDQGRLLQALARSPTFIYGQDSDLRILWTCGGQIFGQPADQVVGKEEGELIPAQGARAILAAKRRALSQRAPVHAEVELVVGGQAVTYDLYVEPTTDDNGVVTLTCVCTDITGRREQ